MTFTRSGRGGDDCPPNAATEVTKYYMFSGQRVAIRKNGVLTYLHADHLGSTVLETNANGLAINDEKYRAYGKQRDTGTVSTDHRFTGQKEDASGLQYFHARFYDPVIGMFVSPDTIVPDAGNVFAYNRTMYSFGNPLKFVDPSGHDPCDNGAACGDPSYSPEIQALYDAFMATDHDDNYTWEMFYADLLWSIEQAGGTLTTDNLASMPKLMETAFNARHGGTAPPMTAPYIFFLSLFRPEDLYAAVERAENQRVAQLAAVLGGLAASGSGGTRPGKYRPFYRVKSSTQTLEDAMGIESSSVLKGGPAQGSNIPAAKARTYVPSGVTEYMEFYTNVEPSSWSPNYIYWHSGYPGVSDEGDLAVIPIIITKNTFQK